MNRKEQSQLIIKYEKSYKNLIDRINHPATTDKAYLQGMARGYKDILYDLKSYSMVRHKETT